MPEYLKDDASIVHVKDTIGSEFTICSLAFDVHTVPMSEHPGPANCSQCKYAVARMREAIRGVRFSGRLISSRDVEAE